MSHSQRHLTYANNTGYYPGPIPVYNSARFPPLSQPSNSGVIYPNCAEPEDRYSVPSSNRPIVYPYPWTVYQYGVPPTPPQPTVSPVESVPSAPPTPGIIRYQRYGSPPLRSTGPPVQQQYPPVHMPSPSSVMPHESSTAQRTGSVINGLTPSPVESVAEGSLKDQCEAIFRHPLFPLLRLLIEKLEEATVTSVTPSREAINTELEGLVRKIQQNHSSVSTGSPEIDDLVVQGVNVLRLHLFELEKVNELCRDFCNRYTDCLRRNLHTDQILRSDGMDSDNSNGSFPPPNVENVHCGMLPVPSNVVPRPYEVITPPHGIAPHSMPGPPMAAESPAFRNDQYLGNAVMSPLSGHSHYDDSKMDHDPDDSSSPKGSRSNRRGVLPKDAINVMKTWLFQHIVHPYPTEDEKRVLALQTQLSLLQVNNWFINARRRILQPMLDSSNPVGHRPKKGMQSRPVDPFWSESAASVHPSSAASENGSSAEYHDMGNMSDDAKEEDSDNEQLSEENRHSRSQ